jgi:hypothetical protein
MQACFAIFSAVLLFMLPDTPRWYYARGKEAQGDRVLARLHALPVEHKSVQAVKADILASMEEENDTGKISIVTLFWDNTELQFGRRLRTSFLINWVSILHSDLLLHTNVPPGATIPWYQHAGIFLDTDLHQPQLLPTAFRYPRWCSQHRFRRRILSSNLVHRESRSSCHDDLVSACNIVPNRSEFQY